MKDKTIGGGTNFVLCLEFIKYAGIFGIFSQKEVCLKDRFDLCNMIIRATLKSCAKILESLVKFCKRAGDVAL